MNTEFSAKIDELLRQKQEVDVTAQKVLLETLTYFASETGTIHRLDSATGLLRLVAQVGLPPQLMDAVKTIPVGKGIAGQVVAQGKPVTICNLQTDSSGVARPGAKQTGVGGTLCVPIRVGDTIVGTFGVGTRRDWEYTPEQTRELEEVAGRFGAYLG
jgi:L-methionine (R)-S-oxide reductase